MMSHVPPAPVPYVPAQEHEAAAFLEQLSRMAGAASRGKYTCEVGQLCYTLLDDVHTLCANAVCLAFTLR